VKIDKKFTRFLPINFLPLPAPPYCLTPQETSGLFTNRWAKEWVAPAQCK